MKLGDMVHIFIPERDDPIDTIGIIIDIIGHKSTVLCEGSIEHWDLSDLEKMAEWKKRKNKEVANGRVINHSISVG